MNPDSDNDAAADQAGEIEFPVPKGYNPPVASRKGEEFTAIATFRIEDDGMMVITKVEGVPVSSENPDEDEGPETSPEMMTALQQGGATNASQGMPAASTY